jgi:hypothetical protein
MVEVSGVKKDFETLEPKFKQIAALLDLRGKELNLCNQAPENLMLRILRQKNDNETCWDFYKRMVAVSRETPPINTNSPTSFAEQLSNRGNDVLTDPFRVNNPVPYPFTPVNMPDPNIRLNNFNEDPGRDTLLLMLFLALLRMIVNTIFTAAFTPMKWITNGVNSLYQTLTANPLTAGSSLSASARSAETNASTGGPPAFGIPGIAGDLLTGVAVALTNIFVDFVIKEGPKLARDVTRYDSVMISSHIQSLARGSKDSHWPEAVLLYAQFSALQEQFATANNMFGYFEGSSLSRSPINASPLMPADLASVLGLQRRYTGDALDQMGAVLTGVLVETAFCCMLRLLASLDPKFLRTMQAILQLELNSISIQFESLDSILSNLWQTIQNTILSAVMSILFNLLGEVEARIKPFFAGLTPGSCIQWGFLTQSMLQYIRRLEDAILSLVLEYNNSLRLQRNYTTLYTQNMGKSQYIRLLNSLLNLLINARLSGQICSNSNIPTDTELIAVFSQFSNLIDYQPLSPTTVISPTTGRGTVPTGPTGSTGASNNNKFNDCLKNVSPEEVAQVQAWINNLKNMAQ